MKTTLALLLTALFFLGTPLLASAHDSDRGGGKKHAKGWVKERHGADHYRHDRGHRWERKAGKHYKRHLREQRRELRHERRHLARHFKRQYQRPYYREPAVIYGVPRIVFRFGW